jgi:tripartite-type tricarboxylate transporter receptor subunit TctC
MKRAKPLVLACMLLCGSGAARADDYPSKSVRLIVPFAAGGAVGAVARVLSAPLSISLGQSMVIDNRGGAGGIIGMDAVAKSPPDGYTLLLVHSGLTYMPGLYRNCRSIRRGILTASSPRCPAAMPSRSAPHRRSRRSPN